MVEIVEAPQPYIVGIHSDALREIPPYALEGAILVDLDRGKVTMNDSSQVLPLPPSVNTTLHRVLRDFLSLPLPTDEPRLLNSPDAVSSLRSSLELRVFVADQFAWLLAGFPECTFWVDARYTVV